MRARHWDRSRHTVPAPRKEGNRSGRVWSGSAGALPLWLPGQISVYRKPAVSGTIDAGCRCSFRYTLHQSNAAVPPVAQGNSSAITLSAIPRTRQAMQSSSSSPYEKIVAKLARQEPVILDGGIGTELQRQGLRDFRLSDSSHWGLEAVDTAADAVMEVHKRYISAGCDVVTTSTYAVLSTPENSGVYLPRSTQPTHWLDLARNAIELARHAIDGCQKQRDCAIAFSIGGDITTKEQLSTVRLLVRAFKDVQPDLVLFETLSMVAENYTREALELIIGSGIPVWLSFRRCQRGLCGIYGQLWGEPEGDYFGRVAQQLEQQGAGAILINCLPVDMVSGTLPWLRDFTDLPLGAYPNLGRYLDPQWKFDETVTPADYADMALMWRAEGAQILGGCCGVGPDHIQAMAALLEGTTPSVPQGPSETGVPGTTNRTSGAPSQPKSTVSWNDDRGRVVYPLPLPEIHCDPEVFVPTQGSYLLWKYLFSHEIGRDKTCLDVGCGTGILSVQLALNGADHVTSIDIQKAAVANTLTNAFHNGVAERIDGVVLNLYNLDVDKKYDLVVASLYQMPTDPTSKLSGHRPVDFWGRNLLDHLIGLLPELLAEDGVAYVMQISLLSRQQTTESLESAGLESRLIDFNLYNFNPIFVENLPHIFRVEASSDAFHFQFRDEHVMVMYLLEIRCQNQG